MHCCMFNKLERMNLTRSFFIQAATPMPKLTKVGCSTFLMFVVTHALQNQRSHARYKERKQKKRAELREQAALYAEELRVMQETDALRQHQEEYNAHLAERADEERVLYEAEQERLQREKAAIEERAREAAAQQREEDAKESAMKEVCWVVSSCSLDI